MRYIKKTNTPDFFTEHTKDLSNWSDYLSKNKRQLKQYILNNEQSNLCCYCEGSVSVETSHIEHFKPKSAYGDLTFDYDNLLVSCNGECNTTNREYCGHKKENKFNEDLLLNPSIQENISEFFTFTTNGEIKPSDLDLLKSKHTIDELKLNTNTLQEARKTSLKTLIDNLKIIDGKKDMLTKLLAKNNLPYITFLRFYFKKLL
jgi:uncharacterized protein (TIGR02646 family)